VLIALALRSFDLPGDIKFAILAPSAVIMSFGLAMIGPLVAHRFTSHRRGR
jgi:hypothetical protein